jgi:hypothetical protein
MPNMLDPMHLNLTINQVQSNDHHLLDAHKRMTILFRHAQ